MPTPEDLILHAIDADSSRDPLSALAATIRNDVAFDAGARTYVAQIITWRRSMGLFNRAGTNAAFHIINYVVYLHLAAKAGQIEHGATFSRLLAICEARGNCGSRALRTILAGLTLVGQLRKVDTPSDRRIQIYVPADALLQTARNFYGSSLSVLDVILGDTHYGARMNSDPSFLTNHVARIGKAIIEDGVVITEFFPELHDIINLAGGLPTSLSFAEAQMRGIGAPATKAIARNFSLSTSQVRHVTAQLASRGLISRSSDGNIVDATPLLEQHLGLLARELALHVKFGFGIEARLTGDGPADRLRATS